MITFSNIPKSVQKTLFDRMDMLDKNKLTKIGKPLSTDTGDQKQNYMFSRSTFMRMISLQPPASSPSPIILSGGEADHKGNLVSNLWGSKGRELVVSGFGPTGHDPSLDIFQPKINKHGKYWAQGDSQPHRPMPGVKDISVEYKGGGRTLAATRGAEINWTCWTYHDLDRLTAHFLHTGNTVFIDWGWSGVGDLNPTKVEPFPILKEKSDGELEFADPYVEKWPASSNPEREAGPKVSLLTMLPDHIIKQGGNYDAMIGIVQDFEWSVRDDGGFDCVTTLISTGVNILQQSLKTSSDPRLASLPAIIKDTTSETVAQTTAAGRSMRGAAYVGFTATGLAAIAPEPVVSKVSTLVVGGISGLLYGGGWIVDRLLAKDKVYISATLIEEFEELGTASRGNNSTPVSVTSATILKQEKENDHFIGTYTGSELLKRISPYITFDLYMKDAYSQLTQVMKINPEVMKSGHIIRIRADLTPGFKEGEKGEFEPVKRENPLEEGYDVTSVSHEISWSNYGQWHNTTGISGTDASAATSKKNRKTQRPKLETWQVDEMYVTWGWFEDNVLSRFFSRLIDNGQGIMGEFRSFEENFTESGDLIENVPVKIRNHEKMLTTDLTKFLLLKENSPMESWVGKKWKTGWTKTEEEGTEVWLNKDMFKNEAFLSSPVLENGGVKLHIFDDQDKDGNFKPDSGILRNVYFNVRYLMEKMQDDISIESAILSVWNDFSNEYGGIYDFYLDYSDDQNRIVVKDRGWTLDSVKDALDNPSHPANPDPSENETPGSYTDGLFEFPTWEKNSIVKSQNLSARLPDRMKLVAMYGASNLPEKKDDDSFDTTHFEDRAGLAWGRLTAPIDPKIDRDGLTTEEYEKKVLAAAFVGTIDYPWRDNRSFGSKTANIDKELYVQQFAGKTNLTFPGDGTIMYDSIIQKVMEKEYIEYVQTMKEIAKEASGNDTLVEATKIADYKKIMEDRKILWEDNMSARAQGKLEPEQLFGMYQVKNDSIRKGGALGEGKVESAAKAFKLSSTFKQFMMKAIGGRTGIPAKSDPIVPIDFELEVDGVAAIYPGNAFQSSYLPEKYKKIACFQVMGVNQKLDSTGWTSTVKGQIRVSIPPVIIDGEGEGAGSGAGAGAGTGAGTGAEAEPVLESDIPDRPVIKVDDPEVDILPEAHTDEPEESMILLPEDMEITNKFGIGNMAHDIEMGTWQKGHFEGKIVTVLFGTTPLYLAKEESVTLLNIDTNKGTIDIQIEENITSLDHADRVTSEIISNITKNLPGELNPDDVDALYQNIFNQMTDPDYESSRITINMGMDVMGTQWNPSTLPSQIIIDPSIFDIYHVDPLSTGTPGLPGNPSDRRLKKNIELIGKSPSGINIYEWEYKDVNFINILSDRVYGDGKYRGVMADDIPFDAVTELDNGYLAVNYSKIDVDFEKIKRYKNDHRPT